jgi:hypothetical protein
LKRLVGSERERNDDGLRGEHVRGVLAHGDVLQPLFQYLDELLWEFDVLASLTGGDITEDIAYRSDGMGDGAGDAGGVLALLFLFP